jgi:CheY-like chemotaxis protein
MTELGAIVEAAIEQAQPLIDAKRHTLSKALPSEPVTFAGDPLRLAQVLSNLLTNAAKYTDRGGQIRVEARADPGWITISVADNGVGLAPESLPTVFTMFSQIRGAEDRSDGGLGIGLALAQGLMQLHGGSIEARSDGLGRGSEFIVRIPRRAIEIAGNPPEAGVDAPSSPAPRRVLIADDNRDAADSLAMLLENEGHHVTVASNGAQALEHILTHKPDVALLDIGMPKPNGYEVARLVRENAGCRDVLLVAVTGWGQEGDKLRAREAGFDLHFTKPVEPERIIQLLGSMGIKPS